MGETKQASYHDYHNCAMAEGEEQAASDRKLAKTDESSGRIIDGAAPELSIPGNG
jgi:hypothetical protein